MYATVFASLVAAIASVGSQTSSYNPPPDAWKTVSQPDTFYLMYRSFKVDPALGNTGKCVSKRSLKIMESRVKYLDDWSSPLEKTVRITLARSDSSTTGDTIQIRNAYGRDMSTTNYRLVYSDYGTCEVLIVLGTREKKCELWVKEGYQQLPEVNTDAAAARYDTSVKGNITKCKEEYKKRCKEHYQIYDKAMCSFHEK